MTEDRRFSAIIARHRLTRPRALAILEQLCRKQESAEGRRRHGPTPSGADRQGNREKAEPEGRSR